MDKITIKIKPFKIAFSAYIGWRTAEFLFEVAIGVINKLAKGKEEKK